MRSESIVGFDRSHEVPLSSGLLFVPFAPTVSFLANNPSSTMRGRKAGMSSFLVLAKIIAICILGDKATYRFREALRDDLSTRRRAASDLRVEKMTRPKREHDFRS